MNTAYFFYKTLKYFKDKDVSILKKILFILPILYFLSPITIIPYYFFPLAGLLDNTLVLLFGLYYIRKTIGNYDPNKSSKDNKKDKKKDNVIDINKNDYDFK